MNASSFASDVLLPTLEFKIDSYRIRTILRAGTPPSGRIQRRGSEAGTPLQTFRHSCNVGSSESEVDKSHYL